MSHLPSAEPNRWLRPLYDRHFRTLLLILAGTPILLGYLWQTLLQPVLDPTFNPEDFWVYQQAAIHLQRGEDFYQLFFTSKVSDPAFNRAYIYPPLVAWAVQPLVPKACAVTEPPLMSAAQDPHSVAHRGCGHRLDLAQMLFQQLCLVSFLIVVLRALGVRDRQRIALYAILAGDLFSVRINLIGQVNMPLLLCAGIWFAAYLRGDRWWGGAAAGLGIAIKLLLAPLLLLSIWRRGWRQLLAAAVTVAVLWALAAPRLLPEYLLKVLPAVGGGTGFRENEAPLGTISRILHPATFYGQTGSSPWDVKLLAGLVALGVVFVCWRRLRGGCEKAQARALEASLLFAAMPLVLTMQSPSQFVTVLIPLFVLLERAFDRQDPRLAGSLIAVWALLGPVHTSFLWAIANGVSSEWILRPWAEMGLVGLVWLFWLCWRALGDKPAPALLEEA